MGHIRNDSSHLPPYEGPERSADLWVLLAKDLLGELPPEDRAGLETHLAALPERDAIAQLRHYWTSRPSADRTPNVDAALAAALDRITSVTTSPRIGTRAISTKSLPPGSSNQWRRVGFPAAIGAIVLLVGVAGWWQTRRVPRPHRIETYATTIGERTNVTLPDGTRVTLAPQTILTIAPSFGHDTRSVHLAGEAYFDVKTADGVPFIVHTRRVTTKVLGTTFGVRHYLSDPSVQVSVWSGKVAASRSNVPVTVVAGEGAELTDSTSRTGAIGSFGEYTDWKNGFLVFKRTPVPTLLASLGRWYGYQFRLADSSLATQQLTATFKVDDPQEMMNMLKVGLRVSLSLDGRVITLVPQRNDERTPRTRGTSELMQPSTGVGR